MRRASPAPPATGPAGPPDATRAGCALLVVVAGVVGALHARTLSPALPVRSAELGPSPVQGGFLLSTALGITVP